TLLAPVALTIKSSPCTSSAATAQVTAGLAAFKHASLTSLPPMMVSNRRIEPGASNDAEVTVTALPLASTGSEKVKVRVECVPQPSRPLIATCGLPPSVGSATGKFNVPSTLPLSRMLLGTGTWPLEGSHTPRVADACYCPLAHSGASSPPAQPTRLSALPIAVPSKSVFMRLPQSFFVLLCYQHLQDAVVHFVYHRRFILVRQDVLD